MIDCPTYYIAQSMVREGLDVWKLIFNAGDQKHAATVPFLYSTTFGGEAVLFFLMLLQLAC